MTSLPPTAIPTVLASSPLCSFATSPSALRPLLRVLPSDQRDPILRAVVEPFGLEIKPRRTMTPAEELAETRAALATISPFALELINKRVGR